MQIKVDLDNLSKLKFDIKQFRTNIELIKNQQIDTPELTCKINTLNEEYHYLNVLNFILLHNINSSKTN